MNLFTLFVNGEAVKTSSRKSELVNMARSLWPANCRVVNEEGRCVFMQTATHQKDMD